MLLRRNHESSVFMYSACDYWRQNRYELKPYLAQDWKKHPFAVGGYNMVCSFVEDLPFAKSIECKMNPFFCFILPNV